ncbi:MAG: PAS domain-containing protein [Burkholderiales bacterium]|nr:PAS domain-containing protein [Burkholderiales bacterium]
MPTFDSPQDPSFDLEQLHLALDMSGVGIWRMDIARQVVHANAASFRLLGLQPRVSGLAVEAIMSLIHPEDRAGVEEAAHRSRQLNQAVELVSRFRHRDGRWRHVLSRRMPIRDAQGHLVSFFGMLLDVTERLRDEQRLRDANQRIALIARTAGIGTWEWDLPDGHSRWDEQMFLLRGLAPQPRAPSLEQMTRLVHPDDRDRVSQQIFRASAGDEITQYEFRVLLPDGSVRWLASRSMPVLDEQGRVVRRIGVNWDITAARAAEQERQAAALAQRESEAKSELLARMSHELRTPLNAILGFTELMLAAGDRLDEPARRSRLEHIQSAGRHLLALINDVLELARPGAEATHPLGAVPLAPLLADTLPLVEGPAAERQIRLHPPVVEPPDLAAHGDALWIRQVLLNLLTNAIKYNRRGGWVQVTARATSDERLLVTVRDSGHGMTQEALERAFEPFQRAAQRHPGVPGVGIGLAVVRTLMQRMGGEVTARSVVGQGSEFELWLRRADEDEPLLGPSGFIPLEEAPPAGAGGPRSTVRPAPSPRPLLLYIEDNEVNVMIVQELAERRPGLRFAAAPDGRSGLAMAVDLAPALILLDMQLPDMPGTEVLARLRADPRTARIPCIALSANAMREDIHAALAAGFVDYWTKPLDFELFNRAMDALLQPPMAG